MSGASSFTHCVKLNVEKVLSIQQPFTEKSICEVLEIYR